jgi:hypothetical protein
MQTACFFFGPYYPLGALHAGGDFSFSGSNRNNFSFNQRKYQEARAFKRKLRYNATGVGFLNCNVFKYFFLLRVSKED